MNQKQYELEAKYGKYKKEHNDEIIKMSSKCAKEIKELRDEVETKRTADLRKEASDISEIRAKLDYGIQRLEKKHSDDSKQLHSKYIVNNDF